MPGEFEVGWADQSGQARLAGAEWTSEREEIGQGGTGDVRVRVGSTSWRGLKTFVNTLALSLE